MDTMVVQSAGKLLDYGAIGVLALILFITIILLVRFLHNVHKEHQTERSEWLKVAQQNFETIVQVTKDNTDALSGIKTLVESIDRRN